ncbi:hypothetical protein NDU88_004614 [Pleurodeles waltl]|uniref:Uncharacterized protein n=1 Tax=Pleurodeles waltl TaxID=8319 RepID=A0AAV7V1N6_PLEWA|nr:hypothetical protein NDU88_004614 [Pleurodeles waltl]
MAQSGTGRGSQGLVETGRGSEGLMAQSGTGRGSQGPMAQSGTGGGSQGPIDKELGAVTDSQVPLKTAGEQQTTWDSAVTDGATRDRDHKAGTEVSLREAGVGGHRGAPLIGL